MMKHRKRKSSKNRSFKAVEEGVPTKRPAPPGKPERGQDDLDESELQDIVNCRKEE